MVVRKAINTVKYLSIENYVTAFNALVQPILLYGWEIWGVDFINKHLDKSLLLDNLNKNTDRIYLKFLKNALKSSMEYIQYSNIG